MLKHDRRRRSGCDAFVVMTLRLRRELRRQIERHQEGEAIKRDECSPLLLRHLARLVLIEAIERRSLADFHALGHTCITRWVLRGLHPKVVQILARHSTMELTMAITPTWTGGSCRLC